jgi:hypothetical protein
VLDSLQPSAAQGIRLELIAVLHVPKQISFDLRYVGRKFSRLFLGAIGISLAFNRCRGLQHLFNELQQMPEHNCANPEQVHGAFRARIIK